MANDAANTTQTAATDTKPKETKTADGWIEQVPEPFQAPEGCLNNLEDDHWDKLYQMWDTFFSVCDRATGNKEQKEGFTEDWGVDEGAAKKQSGGLMGANKALKNSGIEKEDDAKAAAQARAEEANMEKLLTTYGPEALRNAFWRICKRDDPDITMLRFLRARKWNVEQTIAMMASSMKWRLDTNLEVLLENGDLGNGKQIPKYIENFDENGKVSAYRSLELWAGLIISSSLTIALFTIRSSLLAAVTRTNL